MSPAARPASILIQYCLLNIDFPFGFSVKAPFGLEVFPFAPKQSQFHAFFLSLHAASLVEFLKYGYWQKQYGI
jgi:hypothetical protein